MATLILRTREIVADSWPRVERPAAGERPRIPDEGALLVPLEVWLAERETLKNPPGRIGVWVDPNADPDLIARDLPRFRAIAIHLPVFSDGRAYSLARVLRQRYGFQGELRVFGDVRRDQILFLSRCGFDALELAPDQDPEEARAGLEDFDGIYQSAVDAHLPLHRRHLHPVHGRAPR